MTPLALLAMDSVENNLAFLGLTCDKGAVGRRPSEVAVREGAMFNKVAFKGAKRQKELARLKKVEEKRQRRLAKRDGDATDAGDDAAEDAAAGDDTAVDETVGDQIIPG